MVISSADTHSSGTIAYEKLLQALREGIYAPGDRLREEDVSAALGLSRTPVREALRRLESDGIIEHRPRIGALVRSLAYNEVVELYEMRLVLERTAAEMAAKHASAAELDTLDALNERISDARHDPALGAAINQDFHRCLCLAARNRFLLEAARNLNNALLLLGPTTYTDKDRIDVVVAQHQRIVLALRAQDGPAAAQAAAEHLEMSLRHRLAAMAR